MSTASSRDLWVEVAAKELYYTMDKSDEFYRVSIEVEVYAGTHRERHRAVMRWGRRDSYGQMLILAASPTKSLAISIANEILMSKWSKGYTANSDGKTQSPWSITELNDYDIKDKNGTTVAMSVPSPESSERLEKLAEPEKEKERKLEVPGRRRMFLK